MADMQRPGWIGGHELNANPTARTAVVATVAFRLCKNAAHFALVCSGAHEHVDEARPGDLDARDVIVRRQCGDDRFGNFAWLALRWLGQHEGDIGGEVAMVAIAGALNREIGCAAIGQVSIGARSGKCFEEQGTQGWFHKEVLGENDLL